MVVPLRFSFVTDLIPASKIRTINRNINRAVGEYVVDKVLDAKFGATAQFEYPGIVRPRSPAYNRRKLRLVGHTEFNVFTGITRGTIKTSARITATATGGRVYLKGPHPWREDQRQEYEAVSARQLRRMAAFAERQFESAINDPKNRRQRAVRRSG